jgi:beta-phosphoglucomutase-like phosphatase (HAD superfamily)
VGCGDRLTRPRRRLPGGREFAAIILDMDGLMLDTEALEFRAWGRAAADFGWSISAEQFLQLIGRAHRDAWAIMDGWWRARPGHSGSLDDVAERALSYSSGQPIVAKPGLAELLGWAAGAGVPVGVASSSTRATVLARLTAAGVLESVGPVTGGDEVTRGKPEPDIFLLAARRLDCPPRACVAVEDSDSGLRAAAAAGMLPFLVPDASLPRVVPDDVLALAYRVCPSLTQVRDILDYEGTLDAQL